MAGSRGKFRGQVNQLWNLVKERLAGGARPTIVEPGKSSGPATGISDATAPPTQERLSVTQIYRRLTAACRSRARWLIRHRLVAIALLVVLVQSFLVPWDGVARALAMLSGSLSSIWTSLTNEHRLFLLVSCVVLWFLVFGLRWLDSLLNLGRRAGMGMRGRGNLVLVSAIVAASLAAGGWISSYHDAWVVMPFDVASADELGFDGRRAAVQLTAELGGVGAGWPTPALTLWRLQEPSTAYGSVLAQEAIGYEDCSALLEGPGAYVATASIPLPRIRIGSGETELDLGDLSVGGVNVPFSLVTDFLARVLPLGFREFSGGIADSGTEIGVTVNLRHPPNGWRVMGPRDAFPEMMEYLALRIVLDLNEKIVSGSGVSVPLQDADIAFNLGVREFRIGEFRRARAFLQLADGFAPTDSAVDVLRGLAAYQLAEEDEQTRAEYLGEAIGSLEVGLKEDAAGDGSLARPLLACLYRLAGMDREAATEMDAFNNYLRALESRESEVRIDALRRLPLRGVNRHLALGGTETVYVDENGALAKVRADGERWSSQALRSLEMGMPRQVLLDAEGVLLMLSSDGELLRYSDPEEGSPFQVLVEGRALGGVQQAMVSNSKDGRVNVLLLDRFGIVHLCRSEPGISACHPKGLDLAQPESVRQAFLVEDRVALLGPNGAVWSSEISETGTVLSPRQLTPPGPVQQIAMDDEGVVYLLYENGNLWRYYEDENPDTPDLSLVDPGTGTSRVYCAGRIVYVLKNDGAIWRLMNPRDPQPGDLSRIAAGEGERIQELGIQPAAPEGPWTIYALNENGDLSVGRDDGTSSLQFTPVGVAGPANVAESTPEVLPLPAATQETRPTKIEGYRLIFAEAGPSGNEVVSADLAGGDVRRLTNTPLSEQEPALCAGNQKIAFVGRELSDQESLWTLWMMDSDGGNRTVLDSDAGVLYEHPAWSPDCRYLAYSKLSRLGTTWHLFVIDFEGPVRLGQPLVEGRYGSWWGSPQEHKLIFTSRGGFISSLDIATCVSTAAGATLSCPSSFYPSAMLSGAYPAVSPDGTLLAYASTPALGETEFNQDIFLYPLDVAGKPRRLTTGELQDWRPVWAPDGSAIYFESAASGYSGIWSIAPDGTNLKGVVVGSGDRTSPMIAFQDAVAPGIP